MKRSNDICTILTDFSVTASYMFPFDGSNQMTANTTATLSEQVESILSSTSTGTISPSEEKLRDSKADDMGDDGRADGSKNLQKLDSMDLDKEATIIQHFRLVENSHPNLEVTGLYPVPDGQHLLVVCRNQDDGKSNLQMLSSEKEDIIGGMLLLLRINFKGSVLCLEETPVERRIFKSPLEAPKEFVMLPMFLKHDESYLPNSHLPMGVLMMANGELHLINLMNLESVSILKSQSSSRFVSVVYCDRKYYPGGLSRNSKNVLMRVMS